MRSKRSHDLRKPPAAYDLRQPLQHQVAIPSNLCAAHEVAEEVIRQAENRGYSQECCFAIRLALEEAMVNAHKHGNKADPNKKIMVSYCVDSQRAIVRVRDEGSGFNPCAVPDCTAPDRIVLPNGRGIMLMHAYLDHVCFNEKGNEVQLVKERC